jgi:hypothetical protein
MLGQTVVETRDKGLPDISKIVGKVDSNISKEYLALLMWTATWTVSQTPHLHAEATLDAMHAMLYDIEGGTDKAVFEEFLHNRYTGYNAAFSDESASNESGEGKGMKLHHVAKYFLACCRSSGGSVKYEEIIPDLEGMRILHEAGSLHPKVYPALLQWLEDRTNMFVDGLKRVLSKAGGDVEKFISELRTMLGESPWGVDLSMRLGSRSAENQALRQMGVRLMQARAKGGNVLERELMTLAKEFAIPPMYPMNLQKTASITLYFAGFAKGVESLVLDFVKAS